MVDLLTGERRCARQDDIAGLGLVDTARVRRPPRRLDVLGLNALDECSGQILGIAAEPDVQFVDRKDRLQMGD